VRCPRCGAIGVDAQGLCLRCRLHLGVPAGPPAGRRNPLLIPGIAFAVIAVVLITAVIVYAATGGDRPTAGSATDAAARSASGSASASAGAPAAVASSPAPGGSGPPSAAPSPSASPSGSAGACIVGVWLEERHDEKIAILNTGVFPFQGSGTFQRYSETGRVTFDYGSGVRLAGANGPTTYEFVFTGFIVYTYRVENGQVLYSNPRAEGTETLLRNGRQDYTSKLEARNLPPRNLNCGSVAMSLTTADMTIELRRTSAR
jgi:hypothetical protein